MPSKTAAPLPFDAAIVPRLACPACRGGLRFDDARLTCAACGRAYPIIDGIPALIADRDGTPGRSPA